MGNNYYYYYLSNNVLISDAFIKISGYRSLDSARHWIYL